MKRIICLILSVFVLFTSTITAFAASPSEMLDFPYRDEWLDFIEDSSQRIVGYDGSDVGFNEYLTGTTQALKYGGMLQALESLTGVSNRPRLSVFDDVALAGEQYLDGQYKSARVTRDFVDRLYTNAAGYGVNGRYKTLEEYGITVDNNYDLNGNISETGTFLSETNTRFTGYLNLENAYNYTGVSFYTGSTVPPCFYVGSSGTIYQNGVMLPRNNIYFLMANNLLFTQSSSQKQKLFTGYMYRYGQNIDQIRLAFLWTDSFNQVDGYLTPNGYIGGQLVLYQNGVSIGTVPNSDSANRLQQFETQIGVQLAIDEPPEIAPPADIPYDDDDTVIILIPIDNSNNVTYISNDDYNYYVNEGDITENNYEYEYNNSTVNLMINNYVDYYINISIGDGGSYDDTVLQTKLDIIIGKLADIFNWITLNGKFDDIFSNEPVYISYLDCILNHIPYYTMINEQVSNVITDSDISDYPIQDELDSWLSDTDTQTIYHLDHVPFNDSWYEPFRERIRNILRLANYILLAYFVVVMYRRSVGLGGA